MKFDCRQPDPGEYWGEKHKIWENQRRDDMKCSKPIIITLALVFIGTLIACATMPLPERDAAVRILARRIGLHGTQLYPTLFTGLAIKADQACQQLPQGGMSVDQAFSLIAKAIEEKTDDPFLAYDIKDVIELLGLDLNNAFEVVNLTPEIQATIIQFVCSFAQGVDRAKQNL